MDRSPAVPLVMPGRFGVLCSPSPYSQGPFDEGTHCVTLIPTQGILSEWAELIAENWNNARYCGWSPCRSVVVRYFNANVNGSLYSDEYYHRAGDNGSYPLTAHRQFLTMAELFSDFTAVELVSISKYWETHKGRALVLDDRLPSLADHKAIQKWVMLEFQRQLHIAFVGLDWPDWASRQLVKYHLIQELAGQIQERERNLQRAEYTIESYEHIRFSMVFMTKFPQLQSDALACICSFLLGHPIANLHVAGN